MKRLIIPGIVLLVAIGLFAVAVAAAQEGTPAPSPTGQAEEEKERPLDLFLERLAENLGVSREQLDSTIDQTQIELIDEAVADGRIDEETAAELKERIANGEPVFPGFGKRHGGHHGGHHHHPFFQGIRWISETAAGLLGIEEDELRERFRNGESLADMAAAAGIDLEQFKNDLLAAADAKLDEKVAAGDITQERADRIYEEFSENIDRIVNAEGGF
jgi:hypothetical protein